MRNSKIKKKNQQTVNVDLSSIPKNIYNEILNKLTEAKIIKYLIKTYTKNAICSGIIDGIIKSYYLYITTKKDSVDITTQDIDRYKDWIEEKYYELTSFTYDEMIHISNQCNLSDEMRDKLNLNGSFITLDMVIDYSNRYGISTLLLMLNSSSMNDSNMESKIELFDINQFTDLHNEYISYIISNKYNIKNFPPVKFGDTTVQEKYPYDLSDLEIYAKKFFIDKYNYYKDEIFVKKYKDLDDMRQQEQDDEADTDSDTNKYKPKKYINSKYEPGEANGEHLMFSLDPMIISRLESKLSKSGIMEYLVRMYSNNMITQAKYNCICKRYIDYIISKTHSHTITLKDLDEYDSWLYRKLRELNSYNPSRQDMPHCGMMSDAERVKNHLDGFETYDCVVDYCNRYGICKILRRRFKTNEELDKFIYKNIYIDYIYYVMKRKYKRDITEQDLDSGNVSYTISDIEYYAEDYFPDKTIEIKRKYK